MCQKNVVSARDSKVNSQGSSNSKPGIVTSSYRNVIAPTLVISKSRNYNKTFTRTTKHIGSNTTKHIGSNTTKHIVSKNVIEHRLKPEPKCSPKPEQMFFDDYTVKTWGVECNFVFPFTIHKVHAEGQFADYGISKGWKILKVNRQYVSESNTSLMRDVLKSGQACSLTLEPAAANMLCVSGYTGIGCKNVNGIYQARELFHNGRQTWEKICETRNNKKQYKLYYSSTMNRWCIWREVDDEDSCCSWTSIDLSPASTNWTRGVTVSVVKDMGLKAKKENDKVEKPVKPSDYTSQLESCLQTLQTLDQRLCYQTTDKIYSCTKSSNEINQTVNFHKWMLADQSHSTCRDHYDNRIQQNMYMGSYQNKAIACYNNGVHNYNLYPGQIETQSCMYTYSSHQNQGQMYQPGGQVQMS